MSRYTEILNLDSELVQTLSNIHQGYAKAIGENEKEQNSEYRASSLLLSALFESLIHPLNSRQRFIAASFAYRKLENPFWKLLAVCGMDKRALKELEQPDNISFNGDSFFYNLIWKEFISNSIISDLLQNTEIKTSFRPVGRLNIPLNIYVEAFQSIKGLTQQNTANQFRNTLEPLKLFLDRASEKIKLQMEDLYHWKKLRGGIIPLEPEILATCICLCLQMRKNRISFSILTEMIAVDEIGLFPLRLANDIVNPRISGG